MEGEMKLDRQEEVEEDKYRLHASEATDLYHTWKMGSLADINEPIRNFFGLVNAIVTFDSVNPQLSG